MLLADLPDDEAERAACLQELLIAHATGGPASNGDYVELRRGFLEDAAAVPFLPQFVRSCPDLASFWGWIKVAEPTYAARRELIWRAFVPWEGSATQTLLQPFALNTHATAVPLGAARMPDANGACITSLSAKAAGGVCGPASVEVDPGMAKPATVTITAQTDLFTPPPLALRAACNGEPKVPHVHYSHHDVAGAARSCYCRQPLRRLQCSTICTRS